MINGHYQCIEKLEQCCRKYLQEMGLKKFMSKEKCTKVTKSFLAAMDQRLTNMIKTQILEY